MTEDNSHWEYGVRLEGHIEASGNTKAILGDGNFQYETDGKNWGQIPEGVVYKEATSVAVSSDDNVYVYNRGTIPMLVFNPDGKLIGSWGQGFFTQPHGITIGPDDEIFCVDNGEHTVKKFTPDGDLLLTIGTPGIHSERMSGIPFNRPTHLAIDPKNGTLYISDGYGNARVHRYDLDGKYLNSWGESGTDPGEFNIVHNIAVDSQGLVYVADRENHRIQIFTPEGEYIDQWVNFSRAAALCIKKIDGREYAFVGEYFGGIAANDIAAKLGPRVTILDLNGKVMARLGKETYGSQTGRFFCPHGIDVDSNGNIYVAEVSWSDFGSHLTPPRELRSLQKLIKITQ